MALPNASSNVIASWLAIRFGLRGPNLMLCNGPTSGLDAVHWAATMVAAGRADQVLVVGVEPRNAVVERLLDRPGEELLDGAAALVVERAAGARERGATPAAVLGRYERAPGLADCLGSLLSGSGAPGVWFTPEPTDGAASPDPHSAAPVPPSVPRHDLTAAFGSASGALGVLQCAAAVGWFDTYGTGQALVTSGDDTADAVAGLLLSPAGAAV
ncbi:beta-ketoacyl synthase N-terminal-like domain-containing protein [Streptomyces sp. M19]